MDRLNPKLRQTLAWLAPFDGQHGFFRLVRESGSDPSAAAVFVGELAAKGFVTTVDDADGDMTVRVTSVGLTYERELMAGRLRDAGRIAFQLLMGASGGVVVWLLTRLAEG